MSELPTFECQTDEDEKHSSPKFLQRITTCFRLIANESSIAKIIFEILVVLLALFVILTIYVLFGTSLGYLFSRYVVLKNNETIEFFSVVSIVSGCINVGPNIICLCFTQLMVFVSNFDTLSIDNYLPGMIGWIAHFVVWMMGWGLGVLPYVDLKSDVIPRFFAIHGIMGAIFLLIAIVDFGIVPLTIDVIRLWKKSAEVVKLDANSINSD
jgi:hypothetical protein